MTEEIIIDCAFYKDGVCASPINKTCEYCKNIDVSKCYHKQLKRLEQENKELKELKKKICEDWEKEIKIYWNALEEIREKVKNPITLSCFASAKFVLEQIDNKINEVLQ